MNYNKLGFGGIPLQKTSILEAKNVINYALDNGINFFDSARGYTISEELIGSSIEGKRDKCFLATKSMSRDYDKMKEDVLISLANFKTDFIDLYQLHNVKNMDELKLIFSKNGSYRALEEFKSKNIIRNIGITSHSISFLNELLDSPYAFYFYSIQAPFNFIEDDTLDLFKKAKSKGIVTIAMKPLAGGVIDNASVAIKYLTNVKELDVLIPGMYSISEVKENLDAFNNPLLSADDYLYIVKTRNENKGVFCHRCSYCMPCSVGIDIPGIFTLEKYYNNYNLKEWAITRYFSSKVLASECINCKKCIARCPYQIDIPSKLKYIKELFENK